jgi:hypothetical protein
MSLQQYNYKENLRSKRAYYIGSAVLKPGMPLYNNVDPTYSPATPSWDPSVDPGPNAVSYQALRQLLGNAVTDVTSGISNNPGGSGTANINGDQLAGIVGDSILGQAPTQPGTNPGTGPCPVDMYVPTPGDSVPILINYNNAQPGDIVIPDQVTPSNTFGPCVPLGQTGGGSYPFNVGSTLSFAVNNTTGTSGGVTIAGTGSPYPTMNQVAQGMYEIMQAGNFTGNSTTVPQLIMARKL